MKINKEPIPWQLDSQYDTFIQNIESFSISEYENDDSSLFKRMKMLANALKAEVGSAKNHWFWAEVPNNSIFKFSFIEAGFIPWVKDEDNTWLFVRKGLPDIEDGTFFHEKDRFSFENGDGRVDITSTPYETAELDWVPQMLENYFSEALAFEEVNANPIIGNIQLLLQYELLATCLEQLKYANLKQKLVLAHSKETNELEYLAYVEGGFVPMTWAPDGIYWAKVI